MAVGLLHRSSGTDATKDKDNTGSGTKLTFSDIASLFVRLRRSQTRAAHKDSQTDKQKEKGKASIDSKDDESEATTAAAPPSTLFNPKERTPPTSPAQTPKKKPRALSFRTPTTPPKISPRSKSAGSPTHQQQQQPQSPKSPRSPTLPAVECSSGSEPITHPIIRDALNKRNAATGGGGDGNETGRYAPLERTETFLCAGAVNAQMLVRASRAALFDQAQEMGADVLVDEKWRCVIRGQKGRPDGSYRVQVTYEANATRAGCTDPRRPVALDQAKGVPGLMTIVKRGI